MTTFTLSEAPYIMERVVAQESSGEPRIRSKGVLRTFGFFSNIVGGPQGNLSQLLFNLCQFFCPVIWARIQKTANGLPL
jgi:hypothetical protein